MLDIDTEHSERAMLDWLEDEASRHQPDSSAPDQCVECGVEFPCKFADSRWH